MAPKQEPKDEAIDPALRRPSQPKTDKGTALKSITAFRRATAWQIHRWPLIKQTIEYKARVHLPKSYLAKDGEDVRIIWPGQDLHQFVHKHYIDPVDRTALTEGVANFVTDDDVSSRKHEYLGPDPRVVGYFIDFDGDIHVKWWDSFLQDQWMDKQKWKFEVELNEQGEWVEKDLR